MNIFRFILVFSIALLFGCASGVKLDPAMKSKLDDGVSINPSVRIIANKPSYTGPEEAVAVALGGIIGAAIVTSVMDEPTKIKNYLKAEKIDVATLVLDEFKLQINNRPDFSGRIRDNGRYRIELAVLRYGIAQKHGFSSDYKPTLSIMAKMLDPKGKVIWSNHSYVTHLNSDTSAFTYDSYFKSPKAFRIAFASAAKVVVLDVLNDLK